MVACRFLCGARKGGRGGCAAAGVGGGRVGECGLWRCEWFWTMGNALSVDSGSWAQIAASHGPRDTTET